MKYDHILRAFYSTPLALLPEKAAAIAAFLHTKAAGESVDPVDVKRIVAAKEERAAPFAALRRAEDGTLRSGKVGVLPIMGVMSQRVSAMEAMSGGVSTERIAADFDKLLAAEDVRSILLAVDSPGGSVFGVQELADKIRAGRSQKKVVGIADSMAASAGYWILSQASEINVTPGGQVGSIGVFAAHEDLTKHMEEMHGVKVTLVSAGKYKTEGNPYGPLTDEARAELQAKVDHYYGEFLDAVAKGRGVTAARVRSDFGEGRMITAQGAVAKGMADRVATLETVLRRLGAESTGAGVGAAAARARAVEIED